MKRSKTLPTPTPPADTPEDLILQKLLEVRKKRDIRRIVVPLVVVVVCVVVAFGFLLGLGYVRGSSMTPAMEDGAWVLLWRLDRSYAQGDVVAFRPAGSGQELIKRVVGAPGDTVNIQDGAVFIDGVKLDEPEISQTTVPKPDGPAYPLTLGAGEYFVLGDNRGDSYDSRDFGAVQSGEIAGRVIASLNVLHRAVSNDPLYGEQTNLAAISIEDAWRAGLTGKGVTVAVVDTGFNAHEDVDPSRVSGKSYVDGAESSSYADTRDHGTSIVGLLAATRNNKLGIAGLTQANILVLKVYGDAPYMSVDDVSAAIRYAADRGCGVIDISVGTPNTNDELKEACDYAAGKGCILVAAAGGTADAPFYPAAYDSVIGVDGLKADLTPRDTAADNDSVFVTAPGEGILSTTAQGGYGQNDAGASYAAAQVAALAAFAKQRDPGMTASQFQTLLKQAVTAGEGGGYSTLYGWGVIGCAAFAEALNAAGNGS